MAGKTHYKNARTWLWGLITRIEIPTPHGEPYLIRYVIPLLFGWRIYFHKILESDGDRWLHDHPWAFISFLVWGRYVEETPGGNERLKSWINVHRATDLHRLRLFKKNGKTIPVYSILLTGKRVRTWGFQTDRGWMNWRDYNRETTGNEIV